MGQALSRIEEFIHAGVSRHVAVINANKLWLMSRDSKLAEIVHSASLILPEKAIVLGSRVLGLGVKDHIGGIMLVKALLPLAEIRGYRIYFLGAKPTVMERLSSQLRQFYPALRIAGLHHGYLSSDTQRAVVESIHKLRPDVLFVAMGTPKQEHWIAEHLSMLNVPVCMGVGGSFDVLAGVKRDAPHWVRALAIEWLYRLIQDPKNLWKRYLITMPWFLKRVFLERGRRIFSSFRYGQT